MPIIRTYDTENKFSWAEKSDLYYSGFDGELGALWQSLTIYDNGLRKLDDFSDGQLTRTQITDVEQDGGLLSWATKTSEFNAYGYVSQQTTVFDNGTVLSEEFDAHGILDRATYSDAQNVEDWSSVITHFDMAGQKRLQVTNFDDGVSKTDIFVNGVKTRTLTDDDTADGGQHDWSAKDVYYNEDGSLRSFTTFFDNGIISQDQYDFGQIQQTHLSDLEDVQAWSDILTTYDEAGQKASKVTIYDDGIIREETFNDGNLERIIQSDNPSEEGAGAASWDRIETYFDAGGAVSERATFYDDGIIRIDSFTDGVRSQIVKYDNPEDAGDGVKNWDRIETYFDEGGAISETATFYDNGIVRITSFEAGMRSSVIQYDGVELDSAGVRVWDRIETYFDENGQKAEQATFYDNGVIKVQSYADGQLTGIQQYDELDTKSWTDIDVAIVQNGDVVEQRSLTMFDNGVERFEMKEDGQRLMLIETDLSENGSAKSWQTNERFYDENGDLAQQHIVYDDADEFVFLHVGGTLEQKVEYDGDESEAWAIRVTDYTAEGPVVVTYDTVADAPEEIGTLFFDFVLG